MLFSSQTKCLQTCGDGCTGFDRLLIEAGLFATLGKKPSGAYRNEQAFFALVLSAYEPLEGFAPGFNHPLVLALPTSNQERLGRHPATSCRIIIRQSGRGWPIAGYAGHGA